ncbi:integrin beta-4 isoform X3 [Conger conger]|uniref:integrin beta-4 isoform X3 n=1 Tax=Conger conger TaxID=82655 RepID=UPI002A5A7B7F|nr:integrin beta-4 isoform X3 [Conger conger]
MGSWAVHLSVWVLFLTLYWTTTHAVNHCLAVQDSSCSMCIRAGEGCAYCSDEAYNGPRCDLKENLDKKDCQTYVTVQSEMEMMQNKRIDTNLKRAQVAPQLLKMRLLPGQEEEVEMEVFEPARGPLDLYILMDFSNSMSDDLDNLKRMGTQLANLVGKLSDDYTIGFGKFVDKVTEPQTDMRPSKLEQPWPHSDPPFSFKNVIPLTSNITFFLDKLQGERISGNLDAPEGGFDAILQTAVCQENIGWRPDSTHLLVFSTESAFHYEADGVNVLAGILPRNDEACHLTPDGNYTHDTVQDYPSVPTLVRLLGKHNIIPIFAITSHSFSYYEKLYQYFPIAELGLLQEDSSNILSILESAFENIRSKISIRSEDRPKAVDAQVLSATGSSTEFNTFKITPGNIGTFKVKVKALEKVGGQHVCELPDAEKEGTMRVKPTTFSTAFKIDAGVLCKSCDCEKTPVKNAVSCHANGDLVCGRCQCYDGWLGSFCNCSSGAIADNKACIEPGRNESCSGRGVCLCGSCVCSNPKYEGPFCQYDKTQCQRFGGFLCNDRGTCYHGQCACESGWDGPACECPKSNQTCMDTKGGICNGRGICNCGRCDCPGSSLHLSDTCEVSALAQLGMCEGTRSCAQCKAWKTGDLKGEKCGGCPFNITMVDELQKKEDVIDTCTFRDEEDDCTYHYTVDYAAKPNGPNEVQMLEKKDCPPAGFLWLIPLIMFLMLLLGLLLLCCWKYCPCCKGCLALLPCCGRGRMVGFKEDKYMLRHSALTSNDLDTPLVRTGPLKDTDVVRWKITDNVHRSQNHPLAQIPPNPKEIIPHPVSLRLTRPFTDNLLHSEAIDTDILRREVDESLNNIYKQIPGAQKVQRTKFRNQTNAGKRENNTIVDTVLSAPRSAYPDIVKLTEKQVQAANFGDLKVVPGYYTVATDREAAGAVEMQEGVEMVDVRVPLFAKDEDDDEKKLRVEAVDVPIGIAEIGRRYVDITIIKDKAKSILTFLKPSYTYSRKEGVANIPIKREIIEDGRTQVTYRTRDLTARDNKDYIGVEGDLTYQPGELQKVVPVKLLELGEDDSLLDEKVKQFVMDLSNARQGAKLGQYPRTTVTITDLPEPSEVMFKKDKQNYTTLDPSYSIPVVRARNLESPAKVHWRTRKPPGFDLSGVLNFPPGETEKNVVINSQECPNTVKPGNFKVELFDPSPNVVIGEKKTSVIHVADRGDNPMMTMENVSQVATSPGGRLLAPRNIKATATGPKNIRLNWLPVDNAHGYKVKYWIQGDPESKAKVIDCKTSQAELTDLYPFCDYEMRVCAHNRLGNGNYSDVIHCQTQEDVPSEPGRLAFNVISPTVTQLSWAEPAATNGDITAYEVTYTPIDQASNPTGQTKKVKIDNPRKRMLLIENLQPSQTYIYNVRACNSIGWGPFRDATINLATQPNRPMSIPIIPDVPIVDAGDEYENYLMYSNEVLRSPTGSKRPSVADEGLRWKYVQLVGEDLDLRKVSWKLPADVILHRLSTDTEASDEPPHPPRAQTPLQDQFMNGKLDQSFLFPGSSSSMTHNISSSSHTQVAPSYHGSGGSMNINTTTTYLSGQGNTFSSRQGVTKTGALRTEEVVLRKRSERGYYDNDGVRDSIVMADMPADFTDSLDPRLTPGVPDTPTRLVFSALGPTALKVSWQEPHCERDVLGYCVLYQLLSGGEVKRIEVPSTAGNTVVVKDLLPNHSYIFKVKAQSQEGWGPEREGVITIESAVDPKSPLSPVPGSPFTLSTPSAPGPLVFTALSPEALQLSWDKPRKPNGDIMGYMVTCEQLHGGGDVRSFQVSGDNAETSLTVADLTENVPYKFKVQARTTQGFGPEREGIITIESQDGGNLSQFSSQAMTRKDVYHLPGEISTRTNVTHTTFDDPFLAEGLMVSSQHTETRGTVTRHVTKEVVSRGVVSGTSMSKMVEKFYEA